MKIPPGTFSAGLTPSFSSSMLPLLDTHEPGVVTPMSVSQVASVPDPDWGRNGWMAWVAAEPVSAGLRSPHWFTPVPLFAWGTVQLQISVSCESVRLFGAKVFCVGIDQVIASPARVTNATPPAANGGSVAARAREDRAKLVQNGPLLLLVNVLSWLMPADEPSGRGM